MARQTGRNRADWPEIDPGMAAMGRYCGNGERTTADGQTWQPVVTDKNEWWQAAGAVAAVTARVG